MKFKWRGSERVPVSFQVALLLFSLMILLSVVSYQMRPESTWGDNFSTLLWGVAPADVYTKPGVNSTDDIQAQSPPLLPIEVAEVAPTNERVSDSDPPSPLLPLASPKNESVSDAKPPPSPSLPLASVSEKFLVPLLSYQVGAGNQFMEYLSAIVMARSLNRTLCLTPFFPGPSRHTGKVVSGLAWEDRYQVSLLSRFTRVASLKHCLDACNRSIEDKWVLKPSREPVMGKWKIYPKNSDALNLNWDFVKWTSTEHIAASLGGRDARCVGVVGLFPGLRWRGAFLAASAFVQPAPTITQHADTLQEYAFGSKDARYLSVHWRFEETECNGHHVGLCFVRCNDGSVINSGLHPDAQEWRTVCPYRGGHFPGVLLHKDDIVDVIQERAQNHSVGNVYLATDGWMRGPDSVALVRASVEALRKLGLNVAGLWKINHLPNFANEQYFDPAKTLNQVHINGAQLALVEQELCVRAVSFLGSGPSTLSLAVFRTRLARRRVKEITDENVASGKLGLDELVASTLLQDEHSAGLHCRYLRHMNRAKVNETVETYAEEAPDGWLDFEACEGRIGRGGRCEVAKCF